MNRFIYVGDREEFKGEQALGQFIGGRFCVQVDGSPADDGPECIVGGENWALGWHPTEREDWLEVFGSGTLSYCQEVARSLRFQVDDLDIVESDDTFYVVGNGSEHS